MNLSYTNRDVITIRNELVSKINTLTDKWTDHSESDLGMVLVEFIASVGDFLSFYMDKQALETYLDTAVQDKNIRSLLRTMNYRIPLKGGAKGTVTLTFENPLKATCVVPKYTVLYSSSAGANTLYSTTQPIKVLKGMTSIELPVVQGEYVSRKVTKSKLMGSTNARKISLESEDVAEGSVEIIQNDVIWEECEDALLKYRGGRYYSLHRDSEGIAYILLSVNCLDLLPANENEEVEIRYLKTLGRNGLVGAGKIDTLANLSYVEKLVGTKIVSITNRESTYGAWDDIDLDKAKILARNQAKTMDRYITLADYENGVRTEPYVLDCVVKDWKDTTYVEEPYLIRIWAVDLSGSPLGSEDAKAIKTKLENKGISTLKVQMMPTEIIKFNLSIALVLKTTNDTVRNKVIDLVKQNIELMFDVENMGFGKRISLSHIISSIMNVSSYIEDVIIEKPTTDIKISPIQYPKLNELTINIV